VRDHGKGERFLLEPMAGGSASDPSVAPPRHMFCDGLGPFGRTTGKQPGDLPSHLSDEVANILARRSASRSRRKARNSLSANHPRIGLFERHFRNHEALTFVSLPRAAGTDDSWRDENLHR